MYKPLSREFLLKRGYCCNSGCTNCPYKKEKVMNDSKKKYEDMLTEEAESGLAAALAAASKARHQKRVPEPPNEPVPEKVESPAPDEIEEMSAAEVEDIKKDISEIRSMITDNKPPSRRLFVSSFSSFFSVLSSSRTRSSQYSLFSSSFEKLFQSFGQNFPIFEMFFKISRETGSL